MQVAMKEHKQDISKLKDDMQKHKEKTSQQADRMQDSLRSTERTLTARVGRAEAQARQSSSSASAANADPSGIVFGGFSGCLLADRSCEWLKRVMKHYEIKIKEMSASNRRPWALLIQFDSRAEMQRNWHKMKRITAELRSEDHELFNNDCKQPWNFSRPDAGGT